MRRGRVLGVGVAALAMAVGAACGNDDDTTADDAAPGDDAAFCDARVDAEAVFFEAEFDPDPAAVEAAVEELEETAPAGIESDVSVVADGLVDGPEQAFDDPEFLEALAAVDEYALANCDLERVEVTGDEYSFEGIPTELDAGVVGFEFTNDGEEEHELIVVRIDDDDVSIEELLELPDEEAFELVTLKAATFAGPGQTSTTIADLEPGRYAAVCDIETEDGTPHSEEGMFAEFEVT